MMKIIDKVKVLGRGMILVIDELNISCNIDDEIIINDITFKIIGIERITYQKKVGLLLSPNDLVNDNFNVNDQIIIYQK